MIQNIFPWINRILIEFEKINALKDYARVATQFIFHFKNPCDHSRIMWEQRILPERALLNIIMFRVLTLSA